MPIGPVTSQDASVAKINQDKVVKTDGRLMLTCVRQVMTVLVLSSVKWVLRVSERLINEDDVLILAPGRSGGIVPAPCGSSCQMKMDVLLVQCRSL